MGFLSKLFKKKEPSLFDESVRLHKKHKYSSKEAESKMSSGLELLQVIEKLEKALKKGDVTLSIQLMEKAAELSPNEQRRREFLEQAENLRRVQ